MSDWSSDVCSSDLLARMAAVSGLVALTLGIAKDARAVDWRTVTAPAATDRLEAQAPVLSAGGGATRDTAPGPAEYREPSFDYGLTVYAGKSATNGERKSTRLHSSH